MSVSTRPAILSSLDVLASDRLRFWLLFLVIGLDSLLSLYGEAPLGSILEEQILERLAGFREQRVCESILAMATFPFIVLDFRTSMGRGGCQLEQGLQLSQRRSENETPLDTKISNCLGRKELESGNPNLECN